jgi:hypothetical protein
MQFEKTHKELTTFCHAGDMTQQHPPNEAY